MLLNPRKRNLMLPRMIIMISRNQKLSRTRRLVLTPPKKLPKY